MKRILTILCSLLMIITLTACSSKIDEPETVTENTEETVTPSDNPISQMGQEGNAGTSGDSTDAVSSLDGMFFDPKEMCDYIKGLGKFKTEEENGIKVNADNILIYPTYQYIDNESFTGESYRYDFSVGDKYITKVGRFSCGYYTEVKGDDNPFKGMLGGFSISGIDDSTGIEYSISVEKYENKAQVFISWNDNEYREARLDIGKKGNLTNASGSYWLKENDFSILNTAVNTLDPKLEGLIGKTVNDFVDIEALKEAILKY